MPRAVRVPGLTCYLSFASFVRSGQALLTQALRSAKPLTLPGSMYRRQPGRHPVRRLMLVVARTCTCSPEVAKRCLSCRALLVLDFSSRSAVCTAATHKNWPHYTGGHREMAEAAVPCRVLSQCHALAIAVIKGYCYRPSRLRGSSGTAVQSPAQGMLPGQQQTVQPRLHGGLQLSRLLTRSARALGTAAAAASRAPSPRSCTTEIGQGRANVTAMVKPRSVSLPLLHGTGPEVAAEWPYTPFVLQHQLKAEAWVQRRPCLLRHNLRKQHLTGFTSPGACCSADLCWHDTSALSCSA